MKRVSFKGVFNRKIQKLEDRESPAYICPQQYCDDAPPEYPLPDCQGVDPCMCQEQHDGCEPEQGGGPLIEGVRVEISASTEFLPQGDPLQVNADLCLDIVKDGDCTGAIIGGQSLATCLANGWWGKDRADTVDAQFEFQADYSVLQ
jgi:hypothetical protein